MLEFVWIIFSFFCGSIPFGVIIAKRFKGIDPRTAGSKNPGTTNVARLCGMPYGILTLLGDILKGFIPVWIALHFIMNTTQPIAIAIWFPSVTALAAVLGHIKSPFLGFSGGKGVATTIGVLIPFAIKPLLCAVLCCLIGIAVTGYVSIGSLLLICTLPIFYLIFGYFYLLPASIVFLLLVTFTHRKNIQRIMKGEEKSWRKSKNSTEE